MRVAITGARGFVGPHFSEALRRLCGSGAEIIATSRVGGQHPVLGRVQPLDVTDRDAVTAFVAEVRPTHIMHLAAIAAPLMASADPDAAWRIHVHGTLNLARTILQESPDCWLLNAGSGLVYGESARAGHALNEDTLLAPTDDYSVTKAAADLALGAMARGGLKCIRLRAFNHTGPGQSDAFVIPALALQIARIEAGLAPPVIRVGNLDVRRDFLDVRDVADAYALVVKNAQQLQSATVLNIACGVARRISEVLDKLVENCRTGVSIEKDPARMRSSDLPIIVGDASRARRMLGWHPVRAFEDTLNAVLEDARLRVA